MHKSGFVNIIGNPNVGKSTLMNVLTNEKLSIITSKSQTTRHRIMGIVNTDEYQIVYSDTPGILKPNYKLQDSMLKFVDIALDDADIILYVTDIYETFDKNIEYIEKIKKLEVPVFLLINKIDQSDQEKVLGIIERWEKVLPNAKIFPISALHKFAIDGVFKNILEKLPESPAYFDKDQITDKPAKFFVSEIVREKILMNYKKEVPYAVEIEVDNFKEEEDIIKIRIIIFVERESQKPILIGHKGSALKRIGISARKDIEKFFDKKVFLEQFVKVRKNWRNDQQQLKRFGYDN